MSTGASVVAVAARAVARRSAVAARRHADTRRRLATQAYEPEIFTSVLPNGIKVISQPQGRGWASLAALTELGPRFEKDDYKGCSYFVEHLAFKSNESQTHSEVLEAIHAFGGDVLSQMNKDSLLHSINFIPDQLPAVVDVLANAMRTPRFSDDEVAEQFHMLDYALEMLQNNPRPLLNDLLFQAAFASRTIGNRSVCTKDEVVGVTPERVRAFYNACMQPDRLTFGATGIDHDVLCRHIEAAFGDMQATDTSILDFSTAEFVGGSAHMHVTEAPIHPATQSPLAYVGIGFKSPADVDASFKFFALQGLLGGGSAFSAGGPGKGLHSWLYRNCLNNYHWMESAEAQNITYSDAGVFAIEGAALPEQASKTISLLCQSLFHAVLGMSDSDLARARNQLKSRVLLQLESSAVFAENMARQLASPTGRYMPVSELCAKIDAVTREDIQSAALELLGGPVAIASYSNVEGLPDAEMVANAIAEFVARVKSAR
ncbi:hypothetical protein PTSG_04766 [Salpingoeca rosetta]|uniref:Uncharacterized protein n=1 Tax=Salpingoeca rosetta (strain ATCC 50818 / BSB-021) TaxID=946362 RepID=F2U9M6_SALR5|nr:uncharacterized protein PTSG_04766 [Salpingoeca rosetta]EGD73053.1 hypothetical protein PTSG_04766 [Salpingoeca rosetta]|eukprot:XP_004994084.1 hypothetical protein PTSG_04766 [Salpingoeca rosetta]